MKFQIYARKSYITGKGESTENQIAMCLEEIYKKYPDTDEKDIYLYVDEGISGKTLKRPKFAEMMKTQETEKIDFLFVYRLDRISRNVGDFVGLLDELERRGVKFVSINEHFDTSTSMGRAMISIAAVFAQLERETIAERVRDNMLLLAKSGRWLGGPTPLGYTSIVDDKYNYEGKKKPIKRLETTEDAKIVTEIYKKFIETESISGVVKHINALGYTSRKKDFFSNIGIKNILQNPTYCVADNNSLAYFKSFDSDVCVEPSDCDGKRGIMCFNKRNYSSKTKSHRDKSEWVIALGSHTAIIDSETWLKVQAIFERRKQNTTAIDNKNHYSLLSGLIHCSKCGESMFAKKNSGGNGIFYYVCNSKLKVGKKACDTQNIQGNDADETICKQLLAYSDSSSRISSYIMKIKNEDVTENIQAQISTLNSSIARTDKDIAKLVGILTNSEISAELISEIDSKVKELSQHKQELTKQLTELDTQSNTERIKQQQIEQLLTCCKQFSATFDTASLVEKRNLIRQLIDRIEWDGDNLSVFFVGE